MVLLQIKDPLELFVKSGGFFPGSGLLSHRDMTLAIESDRQNQFRPSFLTIPLCHLLTSLHYMHPSNII